MRFSSEAVATFIAVVGVLSVFAQTAVLGNNTKKNVVFLSSAQFLSIGLIFAANNGTFHY